MSGDGLMLSRTQPRSNDAPFAEVSFSILRFVHSVFVTAGTDRRSSGTHYTPRSLTERVQPIVATRSGEAWTIDGVAPQVPYWDESNGVVLATEVGAGDRDAFLLLGVGAQWGGDVDLHVLIISY